jgi:hypothetical protein
VDHPGGSTAACMETSSCDFGTGSLHSAVVECMMGRIDLSPAWVLGDATREVFLFPIEDPDCAAHLYLMGLQSAASRLVM